MMLRPAASLPGVASVVRCCSSTAALKINAAVCYGAHQPIVVEELLLQPPGPGEVLVKMAASGVCYSDYHVIAGHYEHNLPVVLGHEGAGVVAAVGDGVDTVAVDDHVVLNWLPSCGTCFFCERGSTHLCRHFQEPANAGTMLDGTTRMHKADGTPVYQMSMISTWADAVVTPQQSVVKISPDVPLEVCALLGCAVTSGVGAVLNRAQVERGSSVVVVGTGGVGLSVIMGAKLAGAARIIAVDSNPDKAAVAESFGATDFVRAGDSMRSEVAALTGGRGGDYVFEAVGKVALQEACLDITRRGGSLIFVGLPGNDEHMRLPSASVTREEKWVTGSAFGSCCVERDLPMYADLFSQGRLPVDRLVSRRYALADINEAMDEMLAGQQMGRGVVTW